MLRRAVRARPFSVEQLCHRAPIPEFSPGRLGVPVPMPDPRSYSLAPLTGVQALSPAAKRRHEEAAASIRARFEGDWYACQAKETERLRLLAERRAQYEAWAAHARQRAAEHDREVEELIRGLRWGIPAAVGDYFVAVLYGSEWPDGFPRQVAASWDAPARQLVVNWTLPGPEAVPAVSRIRYFKADDRTSDVARPQPERSRIYADLVAQCVLAVLHHLFSSEFGVALQSVAINGFVTGIDRATGHPGSHCVATAMVTRDEFLALALGQVDALSCLKSLRGQVSDQPDRLKTVRPGRLPESTGDRVADWDGEEDPDLLEMDPIEFEDLIGELFRARGYEIMTTARSGDEGIDVIAFDTDPISGGQIVIQAKRHRNTIPPSVVRELFGTVQDKLALKGILVTTATFGPGSYEFAVGKNLTLIDGPELVDLLARHGLRGRLGAAR